MLKQKEAVIQSQILSYLRVRKIAHNRVNNGQFMINETGVDKYGRKRFKRRAVRCNSMNGIADIVVFAYMELNDKKVFTPIYLEVKSSTGRQSEEQKKFERMVINHGGFYFIVKSIEDAKEAIEKARKEVEKTFGGVFNVVKAFR